MHAGKLYTLLTILLEAVLKAEENLNSSVHILCEICYFGGRFLNLGHRTSKINKLIKKNDWKSRNNWDHRLMDHMEFKIVF